MLDRERLQLAFAMLGEDLASRQIFLEVAVYGGSAIMLQFDWRRATEDVDALVRTGFDERSLRPSILHVAEQLDLAPDWLNNAVGMFTPLKEAATLFDFSGAYPAQNPGLRVFVAKPHYLLGMKLQALSNLDRGDKDLLDAQRIAIELNLRTVEELAELYVSIHDEAPSSALLRQFAAVVSVA